MKNRRLVLTEAQADKGQKSKAFVSKERLYSAALILWIISLVLPAMSLDNEMFLGYEMMLNGILVGWLGLVLQAYSNLTFLLAFLLIRRSKTPIKLATFTFLLGLSSFLLNDIMTTGDKGVHQSDILSWGWGAIIWITAYLLLLVGTLWQAYPKQNHFLKAIVAIIPMIILGIFLLGQYQYRQANIDEKRRFFTPMTAFTPMALSYQPYYALDEVAINEDTIIAIKGALKDPYVFASGDFEMALPPQFIYQNKYYANFDDMIVAQDIPQGKKANLVLSFEPDIYNYERKADIIIFDPDNNKVVWQGTQTLKAISSLGEDYHRQPDYDFERFYRAIQVKELSFDKQDYQSYDFSPLDYQLGSSDIERMRLHRLSLPDKRTISLYLPDRNAQTLEDIYQVNNMILTLKEGEYSNEITIFDVQKIRYAKYFSRAKELKPDAIDSIKLLTENLDYKQSIVIVNTADGEIVFEKL